MRYFLVLSFILLLFSCGNKEHPHSDPQPQVRKTNEDTAAVLPGQTSETKNEKSAVNRRDASGRKQGKWLDKPGGFDGYAYWMNDTLNGPFFEWSGDSISRKLCRGNYRKGKPDGLIFRFYLEEQSYASQGVTYYSEGKSRWMAWPGEAIYAMPIKGIRIDDDDSVWVSCPYGPGLGKYYEGLFIRKKPAGVHLTWRPDGSLRFKVDYEKKKVFYIDRKGGYEDITPPGGFRTHVEKKD